MDKLIRAVIRERRVTIFLAIVIAVVGSIGYYFLPRQESPDVSMPVAMVITPYPGASPKDVQELVSSKIEEDLAELDDVKYTKSVSEESVSIVVVMFQSGTDYEAAMQDTRNAVNDVQSELPDGAFESTVDTDLISTAGMIISLSGEKYTYEQLASFGEQFKDALSDVKGVTKFNIEGELDKEVKVDVDIAKLNQYGISLADLETLLQAQNIEIPSGSLETSYGKIKVKTPGIFDSVDDIRDLIISVSTETGVVARLSDVADVYMDTEDGVVKFKQNGNNAVLLNGYFQEGKNIVLIGKEVREKIDIVKANLPEDLIVEEVTYQPDDVSRSTNEFMLSLVEGVILVMLVVFLGMGIRNAIVVSMAIPLSILMTFGVMYQTGIQIHQMSLTALIVSLGVLVDNAIVISDTVQVRLDQGEAVEEAAFMATKMSSVPIFAATLTTVAAFSPLLGLPGAAGQFMYAIPMVLIISIIAAYIVAMFITPALAATFFKRSKPKSNKHKIIDLRGFFERTLKLALSHRNKTAIGTFVILILVINFITPMLPQEFFPYVDKDLIYIDIDTEQVGDYDATEKLSDKVVEVLDDVEEITSLTVAIGDGMPKFYITLKPATPSSAYAQMVCKFDLDKGENTFKNRKEFAQYVQELLDSSISSGKCTVEMLQNAEPMDAKVRIRLSSDNYDRLREVSTELKNRIAEVPGTTNVRYDMKDEVYQMNVDVDDEVMTNLGITKYDVQKQINVALYGTDTTVFRKDGNEYNVKLQSTIETKDELENLMIKSSITEKKIPLKQFADIGFSTKQDKIRTYDEAETVEILANEMAGYNPTAIAEQIETEILPTMDTSGVKIVFDGERESIQSNFSIVGYLAMAAIFIIYIILLIQFNSFMQPVVILLTIPLSLIGSVLGLFAFNQPFSLTAFLGVIALIGLVVKNGILLIEYINDARKEGHGIDEACVDAVDKRFNAIILSAMTTVLGLVPLAISGSSLFAPMAVSLMAGLIVSTFLTMVVIPVFYSISESYLENRKQNRLQKAA